MNADRPHLHGIPSEPDDELPDCEVIEIDTGDPEVRITAAVRAGTTLTPEDHARLSRLMQEAIDSPNRGVVVQGPPTPENIARGMREADNRYHRSHIHAVDDQQDTPN